MEGSTEVGWYDGPVAELSETASPGRDSAETLLWRLAGKYVWWKTPEEALAFRRRLVAQVMDSGDYSDILALAAAVGDGELRDALVRAGAGEFNPRSWAYWHYRLELARVDEVPPLPVRRFA